jgi:hypothetical protein
MDNQDIYLLRDKHDFERVNQFTYGAAASVIRQLRYTIRKKH